MVFEIVSTDITVWTNGLGAWFPAARQFGCGVVPWLTKGVVRRCGFAVISPFTSGRVIGFASSTIPWADSSPIGCFGIRLVKQIGRELLARSFRRQQLLRAGGTPSEAPAGPLSLSGPSVPASFGVWMGRYLT
jgi:hypothetical protein